METYFNVGRYKRKVNLIYGKSKITVGFEYNKELVNEIKAMEGASFNRDNKTWTISNSGRNLFNIAFLEGKNPFKRYDKELENFNTVRDLYTHQREMYNHVLTRKHCIIAGEMGIGKTLALIHVIEQVNLECWWIASKSAVEAVKLEFHKWGVSKYIKDKIRFMTYENMVKTIKEWSGGKPPGIVIFDEGHKLKTPGSQRTKSAMYLADAVREEMNGYVVVMTGTPAPKSPLDWWSLCEVACPGFIKESNIHKFNARLGLVKYVDKVEGSSYPQLVTWFDNPLKCKICGQFEESANHDFKQAEAMGFTYHYYAKSENEIEKLYKRMKGLVLIKFKKDCLDLPEKQYRKVYCERTSRTDNLISMIKAKAKNAVTALAHLRELSDGFIYNEDGSVRRVKSPKEDRLVELLDEFEEQSRVVIYAGFTGSIDIIEEICLKQGWKVIRVDGRGWKSDYTEPLKVFQDPTHTEKIAFIGHPGSAGEGLTLTASQVIIYYSNDFNAVYRMQSEDRIHRPGMKAANIIDLIYLPTDEYVLENLRKKRDLQSVTLGEVNQALESATERLF